MNRTPYDAPEASWRGHLSQGTPKPARFTAMIRRFRRPGDDPAGIHPVHVPIGRDGWVARGCEQIKINK